MAAPVAAQPILEGEHSDPYSTESDSGIPNSAKGNINIAQVPYTSDTESSDPDAPSPCKRIKSNSKSPVRFEASRTDAFGEYRRPKIKIVVGKNSNPSLSLKKPKGIKTPIPLSPAMILAEEFQSTLGTEFPSCIKLMGRTQVTYGFWMGLPNPFCRSFMPKEDSTVILEDENGGKWAVKYLAHKNGISARWKCFVVDHNLIEGDVLVFQLIEPLKLKVYILKSSESNEVDGALSLLNLEAREKGATLVTPSPEPNKREQPNSVSSTMLTKKQKKSTPRSKPTPKPVEVLEHSGTNSEEDIGSDVLEDSSAPYPNLNSFQNFRIIVKGQCIDSELPEEVKLGYYKLCAYKKQFLHEGIREGLYYKLVAGIIGETVNLAKEIKNCKLTISKEELEAWDNSLKSFEILGMKVGFLRDKIRTILRLVFESQFGVDVKRYVEAKKEEKLIEEEISKVKGRLLELKIKARNFEGVLGCLKEKAEKYMIEFRDEVDVPW